MRILMTQRALVKVGGSEMVTAELAMALAARGHEVAVYTPRLGDFAQVLLPHAVCAVAALDAVPWVPDVIHGQHHLPAMAAMARFPDVPAIYYCLGVKPWPERPPRHVRIGRYLMMCEWMVLRARTEFGLPAEQVVALPNFIHTGRFSEVRRPVTPFRTALLFGGPALAGAELAALEQACAGQGMRLDRIGLGYGNLQARPEVFLQGYDLVFGIGKCALEALAVGCAVIPVVPGQAGELLTTANIDRWAFSNFSPRYFTAATQIGDDWLRRQIDAYAPADQAALTARMRQERDIALVVARLEALYLDVVNAPAPSADPARSLAVYLEQIAGEADGFWYDAQATPGLRQSVSVLQQQLADSERARCHLQDEWLTMLRPGVPAEPGAPAPPARSQGGSWRARLQRFFR